MITYMLIRGASLMVLIASLILAWLSYKDLTKARNDLSRPPLIVGIKNLLQSQTDYLPVFNHLQKVTYLSHIGDEHLSHKIELALTKALPKQQRNGQFILEVIVFDTSYQTQSSSSKKKNSTDYYKDASVNNSSSEAKSIVLQFSIIDIKTSNKIGEFGGTFPYKLIND